MRIAPATCLLTLAAALSAADQTPAFSWQEVPAKVLPTGDLEWQPQPFRFEAGASQRYIDYVNGDDQRDGSSPEQAWKHHPWDAAATRKSAATRGIHTYVFKRGVIYRGNLVIAESGEPGNPIRLTSDPAWGDGEAVIAGSQVASGWVKGTAHAKIPTPEQVWSADLDFAPRSVWMVAADGDTTRIPLARTPNWTVSDPEDVMSEWFEWQQPEWWKGLNVAKVGNKTMHLGVDSKNLTYDADYYRDALIWTEWGIVMGTPFPTRVEAVDTQKKGLAFQGPYWGDSQKIITGNRYFLEDKPHYLDSAGEFWFEKKGDGGRLYLRLPDDLDPNTVRIEAARRYSLIEDQAAAKAPPRLDVIGEEGRAAVATTGTQHVIISGLSFRFTHQWWDLEFPSWMHKEVAPSAIRLRGDTNHVEIRNCRFVDVIAGVTIEPINDRPSNDALLVSDNDFLRTDDAAITIGKGGGGLGSVRVLRNRLHLIGMRPNRQSSGHALTVRFPVTMEVAGNILTRCYGAGIFVFGGKQGGPGEITFTRGLIHHNKAEQCLLAANDWGAIETWQSGPFYIFNNAVHNPNGLWNWAGNKPFSARLGYAYYLDGGFKNYLFNNIAWGLDNAPDSRHTAAAAFQEAVPTIHNSFFNNTAYRFAKGSNWSPRGGHHRYLGNIFSDISNNVFTLGRLKEDKDDAEGEFPHGLTAFGKNVFHAIGKYGHFENKVPEAERLHTDFASMQAALVRQQALDPSLGISSETPPLRAPAQRDLRLAEGSAAIDAGVRFFVPWALAAVVGEWHFYPQGGDASRIPDEHWFMRDYYRARENYHAMPQHPLRVVGGDSGSYVAGTLEDWIAGALTTTTGRYAMVPHADLTQPVEFEVTVGRGQDRKQEKHSVTGAALRNLDVHDSNLLIEIVFRAERGKAERVLTEKVQGTTGYSLTITAEGTARFRVAGADGTSAEVVSTGRVDDGAWHHLLVEADRSAATLALHLNGRSNATCTGMGPVSLSNSGDLHVGGTPEGRHLDGAIDFLRIALGTLAEAQTTIEELHAWQFNGPHLRDFCGTPIQGSARDAGAIEYVKP